MGRGLSLGGSDLDMEAVVNGGPEFIQRLAELQAATKQHNDAYAQLNLGKDAVKAKNEAGRLLSASKEKHDALIAAANQHAEDVRERINSHELSVKAATNEALNAAYVKDAEAEAKLLSAKDAHAKAIKARDEAIEQANKIRDEARDHAAKMVEDAKLEAAFHHEDANRRLEVIKQKESAIDILRAKLQAKLEAFKNLAHD